jgi:hypothetical protein
MRLSIIVNHRGMQLLPCCLFVLPLLLRLMLPPSSSSLSSFCCCHEQEVVAADKPRFSISGWYHGPAPPTGADQASLQQLQGGDGTEPASSYTPFAGEGHRQGWAGGWAAATTATPLTHWLCASHVCVCGTHVVGGLWAHLSSRKLSWAGPSATRASKIKMS